MWLDQLSLMNIMRGMTTADWITPIISSRSASLTTNIATAAAAVAARMITTEHLWRRCNIRLYDKRTNSRQQYRL